MAIDDNTLYGLTGAQVKELPGKIEAIKGLARVLTTDDYNANSSNWSDTDPTNFNCVALCRLPDGTYTFDNLRVALHTTTYSVFSGVAIVSASETYNTVSIIFLNTRANRLWVDVVNKTTMAYISAYEVLYGADTVNDLVTSSTDRPLSAAQGKALKGLIDSLVIKNAGAPTTATVGTVGKLLEDTTNGKLYICTDATNPYVWEEVGTGGGASALTITITPDQQTEGAFTWTGATIAEIQTAFDNGTEVLIGTPGFILKVIARRSTTSAEELTVALDSYNTMALYLYSDGRGESDLFTLVSSKTLAAALATKQNTLTAGTGISITNGVISCTFANGNGVSY